jgi:NLI interacting factor-like phosphatase
VLFLDDKATNYAARPSAGIPIVPFKGEPEDTELLMLSNYLSTLTAEPDGIVAANKVHFNMENVGQARNVQGALEEMFESRLPIARKRRQR